jgi:hypothetical protein
MRKLVFGAALMGAVAAVLVGSGQVARADGSGASVFKDFGCGLIDGNGGFPWSP